MYLRKSRADEELGYENTLERHEEMLRNLAAQTGIHVDESHIYKEIVSGESIEARPHDQGAGGLQCANPTRLHMRGYYKNRPLPTAKTVPYLLQKPSLTYYKNRPLPTAKTVPYLLQKPSLTYCKTCPLPTAKDAEAA
jgi:hypothetical protein